MKFLKYLSAGVLALALAACGGGGGSAGTPFAGAGGGTTSAGNTQTTAIGSVSLDLVNGAGVSTNSISAIEIGQIKVIVKDAAGALVSGTIVTFSESGVGLLKFAPASQTAMTTSQGLAVLEVRAADQTKPGATTISVTASVSGQAITVVKTLEVTNAPVSGGVVIDPQTLASAINFVSTDPADSSIVLAGAGGNGRTETGVLKFRVVDKNNTPVKGVLVDFVVNPSSDVTLNISQSKTDADGVVITSVSSKTVATAVVIKATVNGKSITTQSDQLKVTTGLGTQVGFEILALKYNLDGALSGDSTDVTARLVDNNSNPVADGVPVVFVATGGKIGTSAAGGCNTVNGACSVKFEVQAPHPADGIVKITGSAKVGESTTLLREIYINMSAAPIGIFEPASGVPATPLVPLKAVALTACTKSNHIYMVSNVLGFSTPSGTIISVRGDTATGFGASVEGGNTVLDGSFGPSTFNLNLDPSATNNPVCNENGIDIATSTVEITANAPVSKRIKKVSLNISYPAGNLQLIQFNTAGKPAVISTDACNFETTRVEAIGSNGLTLPVDAEFSVSSSEGSARVGVSTVPPNAADPLASTNVSTVLQTASNNTNRQSLWLRVQAPSGGAAPCATGGVIVSKTFTVDVTVFISGRRNTQTLTVTYPGN
jgi:hypothetical protein